VQGVALPQAPLALQVATPLPEHSTEPGLQTPTQPPCTQARLPQSIAVPHCPFGVHVWTPLPEHWVVPGTHRDPESGPPPSSPAVPSSPSAEGPSPDCVASPDWVASAASATVASSPVDPSRPEVPPSMWSCGPDPPWLVVLLAHPAVKPTIKSATLTLPQRRTLVTPGKKCNATPQA
jgi:hypothetical protein